MVRSVGRGFLPTDRLDPLRLGAFLRPRVAQRESLLPDFLKIFERKRSPTDCKLAVFRRGRDVDSLQGQWIKTAILDAGALSSVKDSRKASSTVFPLVRYWKSFSSTYPESYIRART